MLFMPPARFLPTVAGVGGSEDESRAALLMAHPGHELRVHGWLELARPYVCVLTDGSGGSGRSRLARTTTLLQSAGARPGVLYGGFTDRAVYSALLERDAVFFLRLAETLAREMVREKIDLVAGDAAEGYNSVHDAWRLIIDAAVALACLESGRAVRSFDFPLVGAPSTAIDESFGPSLRIELDEPARHRKLAAAWAYPELAGEIERFLITHGPAALGCEMLRAVGPAGASHQPLDGPPFYEIHGRAQVAAGRYERVIGYREHLAPLAEDLRRLVERRGVCPDYVC
jgi:hypothetical protein